VTSWSSQPLPSGSLNDADAKYERPGKTRGLRLLLHLADVDAAAEEIFPGSVDVLDRQVHPLKGPGLRRDAGDALPGRTNDQETGPSTVLRTRPEQQFHGGAEGI
jgi:hypothetical protein